MHQRRAQPPRGTPLPQRLEKTCRIRKGLDLHIGPADLVGYVAIGARTHGQTVLPGQQEGGGVVLRHQDASVEHLKDIHIRQHTLQGAAAHGRVAQAVQGMRHIGQPPLFMDGGEGLLGREPRRDSLAEEEAIHKMTGLPADRFGLRNRGLLRPGFHADLVVFDPRTVEDAATFAQPMQPARGIAAVYVNGALAWSEGQPTGARAGRVLRRGDS